ncbi:uncharacterized protein YqgC (DUF456 family) [Bacillus ectoiniformans]|uniref:DUF456 domain-containing protein n=1 Tax=Bacillus ectoiniformans TaxID=1494429 RepID=UPI00195D4736|nr:DUF456 domain-containing protein [Bacillus ectoiniformans]MBM7647766.1 uncharacterized protein YqgC (DUF456 family) [Bacillus ectoiniformans]
MSVVIWIGIIILFLLSFAGMVFPIIPSVLVLWGGFALYYFGLSKEELSIVFWLAMGGFTVLIILADILANSYFVKKYGGSKWGEWAATIGVIAGSFIMPPFGILFVPFIAVVLTELVILKDVKKAVVVGFATLVAFLSGTIAKVLIQLLMITWFIAEVLI